MKLLFDQNLSHKLVEKLNDIFPESTHTRLNNLGDKLDSEVWDFAKNGNYTIVSQDSDFLEIALINGFPPKVIWIRKGNSSTNSMESILRENLGTIKLFINSKEGFCLELD